MRLEAAITGNLRAYIEAQKNAAETAVTEGVREIATRIKDDLRAQVVNAGLGNKLAKTWQAKIYPKNQKSISAAGVVTSKASKLIRAFDNGILIRSARRVFLAIPTENAPKRGIGNKRINPTNFPEHRYGKLKFVYVSSTLSLLVVNVRSKRKNEPSNNVVMFALVPQVKLGKRLDYQSVVNRHVPQLPSTILANWPETSTNDN